jgi:hypothetical protein
MTKATCTTTNRLNLIQKVQHNIDSRKLAEPLLSASIYVPTNVILMATVVLTIISIVMEPYH